MKLKQILLEDTIANLLKQFNVKVRIDKTKHANTRQTRHGESDLISDKDIIDVVSGALEKIAEALIFNQLNIGDRVLLKRKYDNLNIVIAIEKAQDKVDIVIITVMKTPEFRNKFNIKTIYI